MAKKKKNTVILATLIIASIFAVGSIDEKNQDAVTTSGEVSSEKIEWGIKRSDGNMQPDLGTYNKQVLDSYNGLAMGNEQDKYIYLTFDEGYEAGYTDEILEVLKEKEVQATFFLTAHYINSQEDLVREMIEQGHVIGNHTVNHKSMPGLSNQEIQDEIMNLHVVMAEKFEYEMTYFRPPMGEFSQRSLEKTNQLGYTTVMWSFAYEDWNEGNQPSREYAMEKILSNIHNGAIILLHGNSKTNMEILGDVIDEIEKAGYEFKSLDEFKGENT